MRSFPQGRRPRLPRAFLALLAIAAIASAAPPADLEAQTVTTGGLAGQVLDEFDRPLDGVLVTLARTDGGWEREATASREGRFGYPFLPAGEYRVIVERLGFVPVEVQGVIIRSGAQARVRVALRPAAPPVEEIDRVAFGAVGGRAGAGASAYAAWELRHLPIPGPDLSGLTHRPGTGFEGWRAGDRPSARTSLVIDGFPLAGVDLPTGGSGPIRPGFWPIELFEEIEFVRSPHDVEWDLGAGPALRATTRPAGNRTEFTLRAGAELGPGGIEESVGGTAPSAVTAPRFSATAAGALVPDTLRYRIYFGGGQVARPQTFVAASSPDVLDQLRGEPDGGIPGGPATGTVTSTGASALGRLDWLPSDALSISFHASGNLSREAGWDREVPIPNPERASLDATQVTVGGSVLSRFREQDAIEVRSGLSLSSRQLGEPLPAGTGASPSRSWVHQGGVVTAPLSDPGGSFGRTSFQLAPVLHWLGARHQVKAGLRLNVDRHRSSERASPGLEFHFPGTTEFANGQGLLYASSGAPSDVNLALARFSMFVQDRWEIASSFALFAALEVDYQTLPFEGLPGKEDWVDVSGVDTGILRAPSAAVLPRAGWEWRPGGAGWVIRGQGGLRRGAIEPGILVEALGDTGTVRTAQLLGQTGSGPNAPGAPAPLVTRERLSVMGPRLSPPRSRFVDLSISMPLGGATSAEVSAGHVRTDFLPRSRDLNRVPGRFAVDGFGRDLYGEVIREGDLISIRPGSDRRFQRFDVVSALETDGWSEWSGVTLSLAHAVPGRRSLRASYTASRSTDNAPMSVEGWPVLVRARSPDDGSEPAWLEGPSDHHRPHLFRVDGHVRIPVGLDLVLAAAWTGASGTPFTPTVRDLLGEARVTGATWGEPIGLTPELAALAASVEGDWPCLRELRSSTRSRNACRTEAVQFLDARLSVGLPATAGLDLSLEFDAFNLLDTRLSVPDPALFIVDGTQPGSVAPQGGRIDLPVKLNPGFGASLLHPSPGRAYRLGLSLRF